MPKDPAAPTCARCHREAQAAGQRYGRRCHRAIQADQRATRRRELEALRALAVLTDRYLSGEASRGSIAAASSLAIELRPVRPWALIR